MSLRKVAGLLVAFGLAAGLIGAGVSAQFTDQVTAKENINVGTFSCKIIAATPTGAVIASDGKSVEYTAPSPVNSAPGSAPFTFTVQNTGAIPDVLTVSTSPVISAPWSIIGAPFAAAPLAAGGTKTYSTGIQWTELTDSNLSQSGTVTWTVNCGEVGAATVAFSSVPDLTNSAWVDNTINGSGFTAGPVLVTVAMQYDSSATFVLNGWLTINSDASGNIVISGGTGYIGNNTWTDNCADNNNVIQHGLQTVTVTATDGVHTATGTGSAPCPA